MTTLCRPCTETAAERTETLSAAESAEAACTLTAETAFRMMLSATLRASISAAIAASSAMSAFNRSVASTPSADAACALIAEASFDVTLVPPPPPEMTLLTTFDSALCAEVSVLSSVDVTLAAPPVPLFADTRFTSEVKLTLRTETCEESAECACDSTEWAWLSTEWAWLRTETCCETVFTRASTEVAAREATLACASAVRRRPPTHTHRDRQDASDRRARSPH